MYAYYMYIYSTVVCIKCQAISLILQVELFVFPINLERAINTPTQFHLHYVLIIQRCTLYQGSPQENVKA